MAGYSKIQAKAPDINKCYKNGKNNFMLPNIIDSNVGLLQEIYNDLSDSILRWEEEFQIDKGVIACFIAIESANKNTPPTSSHPASGYMQISADTVYETISKWSEQVDIPLTDSFKSFLKKQIPSLNTFDRNKKPSSSVLAQINKALRIPDYNIALGTANIRWLLEAFSENGKSLLSKSVIAYNKGYYGSRNQLSELQTTLEVFNMKGLNAENKAYILKMFGVNGFLQLYYKNLSSYNF